MSSSKLDDKIWFATYRHELCCDTCPNDDDVFIQMVKDARQEGVELERQRVRDIFKRAQEFLLLHVKPDECEHWECRLYRQLLKEIEVNDE